MGVTTVVLADDHRVVRDGLRALLEAESDITVLGAAADGLEVVELVERVKPDVLVADLMMPGLGGLDVAREVRRRSPETRVVILSMYSSEAYVLEAFRNGACGYVLKNASASEFLAAVREAAAGRRYLSPPLTEHSLEAYARKAQDGFPDSYQTLTAREREVLHLSAEGFTSVQIAARLSISSRTAEVHRANLMRKLGLHGQTELIRYAIKRGVLPSEGSVDPAVG